ncbi:FG-GAP-like repeat-containing protein [Streptomyces sp. NPDC018057]|uniref:FG-GAP-like repeat-containing protein n=1 Tax=unclassified Streptomyces TaxID=2593676 RepID=UPI00379E8AD3
MRKMRPGQGCPGSGKSGWRTVKGRFFSTIVCFSLAAAIAVPWAVSLPTHAAAASAEADPVGDGSMSEEEYALKQAVATGHPYELVSARTETTDTWALPDRSWSVKRYSTPVRLLRNGAWVPTDPTLAFAADGSVAPQASTVDVRFSGGGSGPLLTGVRDGRTLSLTWTTAVPKPKLDGNVATYSEVLPGVDLQLKAEVEGFSQLLVVKNAQAATNPALASLKYKLDTIGLDISTDPETGSVTAVNPAGQTIFTSPSPLMWDSSPISSASAARAAAATSEVGSPDEGFDPPPGTQEAQMSTTVSGDTLEIRPDEGLLTGGGTTYPVFIDPSWAWGEKQNWTRVYKHYPNTSFWNTKDPVRVGYEAQSGGSDRVSESFLQLDTSETRHTQVKNSVLRIRNIWSWSCKARPVELWLTSAINNKTTWNHRPQKKVKVYTVNESKGWGKDCAAGNLEFDTTAQIRDAASKGQSIITFGLYASDETDTFGWKKFDPKTAVLETIYNNIPKLPTEMGTNPRTDCKAGGLIGNARVSLYARIDDKDAGNLTAEFQILKAGSDTPSASTSLPAANGKIATWLVPDASLTSGDWTWRVRAKDQDGAPSPWSPTCKFAVDRTRPSKPPVINSADGKFPSGENGWPTATGKARDTGTFSFSANGVADVSHYVWWTDYDPSLHEAQSDVVATVRPPGYGPHFVYAYSVDRAGNRSDTATYLYYAGRSQERDGPTDLNGDANSDIWSTDSNGTLLTYAGQGNGTFATATNGGRPFEGSSIGSRGDWGQDGYNDLIALEYNSAEKKKSLRIYPNDGSGVISDESTELAVSCPTVDEDLGCVGDDKWTGDDHWYNAEQIITPGDINGDNAPDLLVKQGKYLWAYYGAQSANLLDLYGAPVLVGGADWNKFTVIAPGDLNGDNMADLWLREDATGDIWRSYGSKGSSGRLDPTTWGDTAARVKIASGYPASGYPVVGSAGDVTGDGLPDLWARKNDNTMLGWYGTVPGADNKSIGASFVIDGITGGARIPTGTTLTADQSLTARSNKLTMQGDGNLTVTSHSGKVIWQTNTAGNPGATALMQSDGNLTVISSSGSRLWSSNLVRSAADGSGIVTPELTDNGYAVLQDRGNLVLYNAKGQSVWAAGTETRHDYNNDGRSDIGVWYDYADGHSATHTFLTNTDGTFQKPFVSYQSVAGNWPKQSTKTCTGDFNGDGIGDVAVLRSYDSNHTIRLFTALGKPDGTLGTASPSWTSQPNNWSLQHMILQAGDFNGDGRDDLMAWYDYADGHDTLFTFTTDVRGGFNVPFPSLNLLAGVWETSRSKFVTGDFDGDGRDDLGALYGYADGSLKMHTLRTTPTGGFTASVVSWGSTIARWGDWHRTYVHPGDFNGDGIDDVTAWYDYADGHDALHTLISTGTRGGEFATPTQGWESAAGNWSYSQMKIVTGDYDGDGRDDLGAVYGYADGSVRMFTWTATAPGGFNPAIPGWSTATGWTFGDFTLIRPYS